METETTARSQLPNGEKAFVEQILALEERKKQQKNSTLRVTVRDPKRKGNHLSKVI